MLNKEIPFLRICLPLCAGIISGLYIRPDPVLLITTCIVVISGFSISLFYNRSEVNRIFGLTVSIVYFISGLLLYSNEKKSISFLEPKPAILACTLSDFPAEKAKSYMLTVKLKCRLTEEGHEPLNGSVLLYHRKDSLITKLLPGDQLVIKCTPLPVSVRGNPYEFDYRFYMENQGVRYYAFTGSENFLKHSEPEHRRLIHKALMLRERIILMYKERGITGDKLALVAAITLGQKNMLDADQKISFIKAGVMHIMAVSGLHTVILSLFVFNVLFFLKRRFNIIRIVLTIAILWSFAFVTGLTPSVLRATLMFTFLQAGNLMKRPVNGINSVLASAFVLILIRPSVIFDSGFLLSYSAVIYIIAFYRELYQKVVFSNYLADMIWQSAVVTIVAQAGTLPLTIALFNRFPTYFILTNIIIVPLSSVLVIIGCIIPLLFPLKFLSHFLAMILNYLTGLTEFLTRQAASFPLSTIEDVGMTNAECILLTVTIFLLTSYLLNRRSFSVIYPISALLIFLLAGTIRDIMTSCTNELIVYNTPGRSTIGIRTGKILNIYSDTACAMPEVKRHSSTLGLKINMNRLGNGNIFLKAGKTKILISNSVNRRILNAYLPDYVILTGAAPAIESEKDTGGGFNHPVIAADGFPGFYSSFRKKSVPAYPVYSVRKSGAFIRRI
ncbi:MAG: ComEC/Rec2 family competence protein [Bacteroidales bacterium]|nr:ComEC/Rec2 family competence protein [Bacteroidales bacterium]